MKLSELQSRYNHAYAQFERLGSPDELQTKFSLLNGSLNQLRQENPRYNEEQTLKLLAELEDAVAMMVVPILHTMIENGQAL